ncbi:MAG TPA: hypothetical protein VKS60_23115 [Stellaceae bacterium]|nr:hypothetical protein [Stellaceae bacterium]
MGKEIDAWKSAKTQAEKLIGKDGTLPKPRADIAALMDAANKIAVKLIAARDSMEDTVLELNDAFAKVYDAADSYSDIVDGSDFKLDSKDKDQKKTIDQVKKLLDGALEEIQEKTAAYQDALKEFNKHLASVEKDLKAAAG